MERNAAVSSKSLARRPTEFDTCDAMTFPRTAPEPPGTTPSEPDHDPEPGRHVRPRHRGSHRHPSRMRTIQGYAHDDCPVCALEAHMIDPSSKPKAGDPDFPAERMIDLVLKNLHEPHETQQRICSVVTDWCGRPATWNVRTLVLCTGCHQRYVGRARDDAAGRRSASTDTGAHGAGERWHGGASWLGGLLNAGPVTNLSQT